MSDNGKRHWQDLCEAVNREADAMGGFGRLTVQINFYQGLPQEVFVIERRPQYRLGHSVAPLTGQSPLAKLGSTE